MSDLFILWGPKIGSIMGHGMVVDHLHGTFSHAVRMHLWPNQGALQHFPVDLTVNILKPYPVDWLQPQFAVGTAACTTRELSKLRRFWWFLLWHPTFAAQVMPATWERPPLSRGLPVLLSQLQWLLSQWVLSLCLLAVHPWLFAKLKFEKMEPDLIIWHTEMDIKVTQWPLYKTYWGFCNNTATFCPNPH